MFLRASHWKAFVVPFLVFMALLGAMQVAASAFKESPHILLSSPQYWIFPVQTLLCGVLVWRYWPQYGFARPRGMAFTAIIAVVVLLAWIAPQAFFGAKARLEGFDPHVFQSDPTLYWLNLSLRFVRLVIVVPFVEEIFWRGFLLRYLINEAFSDVPIGTFSWLSFGVVTVCVALAHNLTDFWPALLCGAAYNLVAYRTKSLASCVAAHAITNLLLGGYIMRTGQWGFW
jgi:CAAX prenyl protease-like protein